MKLSDERLIDLYLDMLAAERGAAANTLEAYRRDLEDFSADLRAHRGTIAGAGGEAIREYLGRLDERGFSASSVARRLSAIRQLYRFLYAEGNRKDDPAAAIEGPKRGRPLPKVLSISHVDQLLTTARKGMDDAARPVLERLRAARLACLLEVLYATGLRVSELVTLPASAAQRDQRMLIVRGKGNKERLVPLNEFRPAGDARLSGAARGGRHQARQEGRGENREVVVPVVRRERASHAPAFRA